MSGSIRLSPKHGVNPSVTVCIFCARNVGVALCGRLPGDAQAPRHVLVGDICNACREHMKTGCILAEARPCADGRPLPTGRYLVVRDEAVARIVSDEAIVATTLRKRAAYVEADAFEQILAMARRDGALPPVEAPNGACGPCGEPQTDVEG